MANSLWHHQMETFSTLLALCEGNPLATGEFPSQRPVTLSFDVFFDLCLHKQLSQWWRCQSFETPSHSSWRRCNVGSNDCCSGWPPNAESQHLFQKLLLYMLTIISFIAKCIWMGGFLLKWYEEQRTDFHGDFPHDNWVALSRVSFYCKHNAMYDGSCKWKWLLAPSKH